MKKKKERDLEAGQKEQMRCGEGEELEEEIR
jgi:hypothetical protein